MAKAPTSVFLPVLYSRRADGGAQSWKIEIRGCQFRAISGTLDGVKTTSEWTTCLGKNLKASNATTPEAQAAREAQAKWQKKVDSGYKTDLGEIDNVAHFEPMLAHKYKDCAELVTFPVYNEPKLDGLRSVVRADGMWSRNGKPIVSAPHIFKALAPLFAVDPQIVLDGELYADKLANDFNQIISLARRSKPTADELAESAAVLQYHVYDLWHPTAPARHFGDRHVRLAAAIAKLDNPMIVDVETCLSQDQEELDANYARWLAAGYEGQMIRLDAPYENKRSKHLLKRKEFCDVDRPLLDVTEGKGNRSGMAGRCHFRTEAGVEFETGIRGNQAFFRQLLRDKPIGKLCTVRYQNLTPDGVPRFGVCIAVRDYE